jgi:hypothetical protein
VFLLIPTELPVTQPYGQPGYGQPGYGQHPYGAYPPPAYDPNAPQQPMVYQPAYGAQPPAYGVQPAYGAYPPGYGPYPAPAHVPNHRGWAVATIFFGGLIFGIIGIVLSGKVDDRLRLGDVYGAEQASNSVKTYLTVITSLAALFWGFVFLSVLLAG